MSGSPGETLYQFRNHSKVVLQRGRVNVTQLAAYRSGALVAPTAVGSTYTLEAPDGTAVVSAAAVTVTGDVATYTIPALTLPATLGLGPDYLETWALLMPDSRTYTVRRPAGLALFQLFPPVTEADLVQGEYPDLVTSLGPQGSVTLQALMDGAWHACMRKLESHGDYPDIVVDSADVFDWYRHEVLRRVFGAMLQRQPQNERWRALWEEHRDEAKAAKAGLRIKVDRDRDGRQDHLGHEAVTRQLQPNVPPRRRWRRDGRWS